MSDFEDTKKKLDVEGMDELEKKKLFDKFVEGGGTVVDEKKKQRMTFDRKKQKELIEQIGDVKDRAKNGGGNDESDQIYETFMYNNKKYKWASFWDRIVVYFKGVFNKTTTMGGIKVNVDFFRFVKEKVIPQLKNLNSIIKYIMSASEQTFQEIKKNLDEKSPYYYQLLIKYSELFVEEEFNSLLYYYRRANLRKITPWHLEDPLKIILKKIYILKEFKTGALNTFRIAIFIISKHKKWDKSVYRREVNQVKVVLNLMFSQLLPKLYSLLLVILKKNVPLDSSRMSHYLEIEDSDKVDYSLKSKSEIENFLPQVSQEKKEEEKEEEIQYIKKYFYELAEEELANMELDELTLDGIKIMQEVDWKKILKSQKNQFAIDKSPEYDKILHILAFLKEFEKEYSFVLTSYKIEIQLSYEKDKRVDYKAKLNDLYTSLTNLYERVHNYFEILKLIDDVNNDPILNKYEKYNRLTASEGKKGKIASDLQKEILKYFTDLKYYFDIFINDYNGIRNIINNPEDKLRFDKEIEGEKKIEGKKVIEAITIVDSFISAFIFRLSEGGDFSGIDAEIKQFEIPETDAAVKKSDKEQKSPEMSFLDEIAETINDK